MSLPLIQQLTVQKGATYIRKVFWETDTILYRPITGITKAAPARVTAVSHAIPEGWRAVVVSAGGMEDINCPRQSPKDTDWHTVTVVDTDTVDLDGVNAADYDAYTSGGYLQLYAPKELAGYTARMTIKDKVGGTELLSLTTENGGIEVNNTTKAITITISTTDSEAISWTKGVYSLELVST